MVEVSLRGKMNVVGFWWGRDLFKVAISLRGWMDGVGEICSVMHCIKGSHGMQCFERNEASARPPQTMMILTLN